LCRGCQPADFAEFVSHLGFQRDGPGQGIGADKVSKSGAVDFALVSPSTDTSQLQLSDTTRVRYDVAAMARSDVQLMLDVKAGDEQSFALLLQRYRSPLVNFLYRMVRNREQAEDLAQADYVPSAKFTTWLFRIATNLALNSVRDTRHQRAEISLDAPITTDAE